MFCGCGGMTSGFMQVDEFELLLGIDNDTASLETYKHNFGISKGEFIDLFEENFIRKIRKLTNNQKIDVVVAGPPCQGFSLTGTRNFEDKRNSLYLSVLKVVEEFKPEAFIIENVRGMKTLYGGSVLNEIKRRFDEIGYTVAEPTILNSADYGVPQIRHRLFIVGLKRKYGKFEFPSPTHSKDEYISCEDALADLPSRVNEFGNEVDKYGAKKPKSQYQKYMRSQSDRLLNHVATNHTEYVKSVINLVPEGGNYKSLPAGIGESRQFNEAWTRYHSKKPSRTIDTGHRNHFHYKWNRVPTVRENARLQSFMDHFKFLGTKTQQYRQVGNAVPPMLAKNIAIQLLKFLK